MQSFKNEYTYRHFVEEGRGEEFDSLFDRAVSRAKHEVMGKRFPMYINGEEAYAANELEEHSPIDGFLIGRFQKGGRDDARLAIASALEAFKSWKKTGYMERVRIFKKAALLFSENKFLLAAILSIENGKTRYESVGEVDEAIDFMNYYSEDMQRKRGYLRRSRLEGSRAKVSAGFQGAPGSGEKITIAMKPYGVFGVIAPFNFPISISTGMSAAALITGNTVVFKPSSTDNMSMLTGLYIYKLLWESGLPKGVFNYITGPGSELGDELVSNSGIGGIAFTGSRSTGKSMLRKTYGAASPKAFVVEMGGKNPAIVSQHADLEKAVSGISSAAFGFSGQKCSACSRVYVHESIKDVFISGLVEKAKGLRLGDPLVKGNYMGPLISSRAVARYNESSAEAARSGRILYGGKTVEINGGVYAEPTIAEVSHSNRLFSEELFLPFLVVDTYKDFDEAIEKANDTGYGLTAGLYSGSRKEIKAFLDRIEAGVVYVNREISATTGAIVGLHAFVGWKGSGLTGKGTGSMFYLQQFMREQSLSLS